jgi:hypothetical protein
MTIIPNLTDAILSHISLKWEDGYNPDEPESGITGISAEIHDWNDNKKVDIIDIIGNFDDKKDAYQSAIEEADSKGYDIVRIDDDDDEYPAIICPVCFTQMPSPMIPLKIKLREWGRKGGKACRGAKKREAWRKGGLASKGKPKR